MPSRETAPPVDAVAQPRVPLRPGVKRVSLALQGGGSHGAFTWGVLHRLMSDPRIYIDGLSAASAGSMNAVVMVDGFLKGKRQGAIDAMQSFWEDMAAKSTPLRYSFFGEQREGADWSVDHEPGFLWVDFITRLTPPAQWNPLAVNPLHDLLVDRIDFAGLRARPDVKLFIAATNVRTCKARIFRTPELTVDSLLASACLPLLFHAVEIEGESYWDGGYLGNPAIYPLIHECGSSDIIIVQLNPMNRPEVPTTARDILNRINEMSFNASLVREMQGIAAISKLVESGALDDDRYTTIRFHEIGAEAELAKLGALSKMNSEKPFLDYLHNLGFDAADRWLEKNFQSIGWESTLDVDGKFA